MRLHNTPIILFFAVSIASPLKAQYITQLAIGNYGKVHSFYLNPSMSAYSKYKWQINLAGAWVNENNNYLSLRMPYSAYKIPNRIPAAYRTESGNPIFNTAWLAENLNGKAKNVSVSTDVYGPAFSLSIKEWSFGIFTNASASARLTGMPENLAHALYKELDSSSGAYTLFNNYNQGGHNQIKEFAASGNSRVNLGFNISHSIKPDKNNQILLGMSVKKVWGAQGFYLHNDGFESNALNSDSILVSPGGIQMITYGDKMGHGWGTDIGATYLFRKKDFKRNGVYSTDHPDYYLKIGASILDIGQIKYSNAQFSEVKIKSSTIVSSQMLLNKFTSNGDYISAVDSLMNELGTFTQTQGDLYVGLPTRLNLHADMQLRKHFFLAAVLQQSLRKRMSVNARYQSFIMVSPRFEYRYFEFSLPTLLEYDYRSLRLGASMRIGPVFIGTNNLISFINTRRLKDADIFAGIAFGNLDEFSFRKQARSKLKNKKHGNLKCAEF